MQLPEFNTEGWPNMIWMIVGFLLIIVLIKYLGIF